MEDLSFGTLMAGVIFGSLGVGYVLYGRRQRDWAALVCGLALCAVPYFIGSVWLLLLAGAALAAVPFAVHRWL